MSSKIKVTEEVVENVTGTEVVTVNTDADLAPTPEASRGVLGEVTGDIDQDDVKQSSIKIVQKVGDLSDIFDFGQIVIDEEVPILLDKDKETLNIVPVALSKVYQEQKAYDPQGEMPKMFNTRVEAMEAGFQISNRLNWNNDAVAKVKPVAFITFLIECPDEQNEAVLEKFPIEIEDKFYALASYFAKSYAYDTLAKPLMTRLAYKRGEKIYARTYHLGISVKKAAKGSVALPKLCPNKNTDKAIIEFITEQ